MESYYAGTSQTLPYFPDILGSIQNKQSYTAVFQSGSRDYSYATGLKMQTVDMVTAIQREASLRAKKKADYFVDAASAAGSDSQYLSSAGYTEVGNT